MPKSGSPLTGDSRPSPLPSGAKNLQERLHILLTRLAKTTDLIKTWPESDGDDASIHVETTSKLITCVLDVVTALQKVEGIIKADVVLKKSLQECKVPINLLDLLDHGNGLNPDCFSRGLLREALGQLAGLKRRKLALEMLGAAIQAGLDRKDSEDKCKSDDSLCTTSQQKRKVDVNNEYQSNTKQEEPKAKKMRKGTISS
mmetsp:Transcript_3885/g.10172  ORF Transcript_3885/g.10172 Transcript_3885/m.10172 type:complete len:201 (-) Transcript_3885:1435-2037(-)